ncbi:protein OBERON 3 [Nicotiana sylvestris]|uniref:Protein OBERON 3 n=1 Tax=Nicotiana sylvestris TaxID=4096 RepID=A0A1U7WRE8_NICSY|nr:PREDICTED: protein OBERON 3 [Nicotiana sylvestris]
MVENSTESDNKVKENSKSEENTVEGTSFGTLGEKGIQFLGKSVSEMKMVSDAHPSYQELTLSYLCEKGFQERDVFEKVGSSYKGKEVMVLGEDQNEESNNRWVERDFLQLNNESRGNGNSSKRDSVEDEEIEAANREKKPKIETLNLSLALPDVSLSLAGSNRVVPNGGDLPSRLRPSRSVQSLEPSLNNTRTTHSNDFTAASLSCSYSHAFSHNPSCSLTHNSTEYYEHSMGSHRRGSDHIWNCGEGTNGSVHSRFRPIGDGGVALANNYGGSFALGSQVLHKETCNNSVYRTTSSDNISFFPSELPARPRIDGQSGDSRGRGSESLRGLESMDGGRARKISRPERILREIVSESIPLMAQIVQELPDETVESTKEYLRSLIATPERKDELVGLQNRLHRRCDLTNETLAKCHKTQLELFVAIKMGLGSFLSSKKSPPTTELVEIFLLERCRNINCMRVLPVEDCECKICSTKKGFCSECMCPVCLNFDCANNTCSWVGCDACSHWCHAVCGIQRNLIKPGPSFKGPAGTTEMQFYCLGCGHASEMFGFVKDVFTSCAKDWGEETLMKELDCVQKIFQGSEDFKGKELHVKAAELRSKLEKKMISRPDVCNFIFQFFNYADGLSEFPPSNFPDKDFSSQAGPKKDAVALPASTSLAPKSSFYNISSSSGRKDIMMFDERQQKDVKLVEDEWSVKRLKKDDLDSLESIVRIKEAEARMFQNRADDARRDAESFRRVARMKTEKLEEEYSEKLDKLCLQETEERRRKKLEELKVLENSQCDYYKMKMRMQSEISGLLKRMEATKQLLV